MLSWQEMGKCLPLDPTQQQEQNKEFRGPYILQLISSN